MRNILPILLGTLLFALVTFVAGSVKAATLELEKIGTANFSPGATTWTYYGTNPIFQGTASPSAAVSLSVNSAAEASATADTAGNWSLTPTSLSMVGSYNILISSGAENVAFTLNIASATTTTDATASATPVGTTSGNIDYPETLPETGSHDLLLLFGLGGVLLIAGIASGALLKD